GGDYYDFIDLSGNNYAAVIGDATGHGVAAGLVVGMIKMALISALQTDTRILPIDRLMENLNIALKKSIPTPGMGMSLGLAIIDSEKKAADLCFAGMPFPFHYHYESRELTAFEMRCPSLGFFNRLPVKTRSVQLKANDLLIFLSDGFEERMNSRYETWSRGKLAQELHHICRRESNVKKIAEALFEACDEFACDYENQDDMTIVVIKFT
ncbi:MAG: serine/threonine-protein phosphatase, partial [bacterium]|nr:serine/threonine-protein phosphatase [bacterium]